MARSAHIRVDRIAFIAALKARLVEFKKYETKRATAKENYTNAMEEWARKALSNLPEDVVVETARAGEVLMIDLTKVKGISKAPKTPAILDWRSEEEPTGYNHCAVKEIESTLTLLEMSTDDTVSTYTYADVARYL